MNWWAPVSSFEIRLVRSRACFCHLAWVLFFGLDGFCARYTSLTWFARLFHFFFVRRCTCQTSESFLDLVQYNEVRCLQLSEASCISCRILQKLRIISIRSECRNWNFMRHSHQKSRRGQVSGLNCWISFPWHCRIHSSMLSISSFVFAAGNVWNVYWIVSPSIIFAMSLLCSRCPFHLSVDLVPYDVIELLLRHRIESEKTWTSVSWIFDNLLSIRSILSWILFREISDDRQKLQTVVLRFHLEEYLDVKIPFPLSVFKIMIP